MLVLLFSVIHYCSDWVFGIIFLVLEMRLGSVDNQCHNRFKGPLVQLKSATRKINRSRGTLQLCTLVVVEIFRTGTPAVSLSFLLGTPALHFLLPNEIIVAVYCRSVYVAIPPIPGYIFLRVPEMRGEREMTVHDVDNRLRSGAVALLGRDVEISGSRVVEDSEVH